MDPIHFTARVVPGAARGRELGFPTLNLAPEQPIDLPHGVYAARVSIGSGTYPGMLAHGPARTFGAKESTLEVHVIDVILPDTPSLVGVLVGAKLRDMQQFASPMALTIQLEHDKAAALAALAAEG